MRGHKSQAPAKIFFWCVHMQAFFLGSAIILQAMGAHPIALEMMDAMRDSRKCALQPRATLC